MNIPTQKDTLPYFKVLAKEAKEIKSEIEKLRKKEEQLYTDVSKIVYQLYKVFIDKNWNSLDEYQTYYYLHLEFRSDNILIMEELKYINTYSEKIADFSVVGNFQNSRRVNLYPEVEEEGYNSISVIIDKEQLSELEKLFVIKSRE